MRTVFSSRRTRRTGASTYLIDLDYTSHLVFVMYSIFDRVRCSIMCSLFVHFEFSVRVRSCLIIYDFSEFVFVRVRSIRVRVRSYLT